MVWKAWTEPDRVMKWWGPQRFTSPICKIDFRVGGRFVFCMRSPDGKDFWTAGTYKEIVPLERIVAMEGFADEKGNIVHASKYGFTGDMPMEFKLTVTFTGQGDRTVLTLRHSGFPAGPATEMAGMGWLQSFDKLEVLLQAAAR
jgi:uncharacterized protein YndB with AHSA1/START domain